jgi:hypothetical protein
MNIGLRRMQKWVVAAGGALLAVFAIPALAQSGGLAMLGSLTKGEWTVTFRDGSAARKICVRSGRELIQLRHPSASNCSRYVVDDDPTKVSVQYACRGNGYGRTDIRRETGSLVQIQSQGIEGGLPFNFDAEARRTGTCR